eukprot:gene10537-21974_t
METVDLSCLQSAISRINSGALSKFVLEKCAVICQKYSLNADDFSQQLEAFLINKSCDLSLENLGSFEVEVSRNRTRTPAQQRTTPAARRAVNTPSPSASASKTAPNFSTPASTRQSKTQNSDNQFTSPISITKNQTSEKPTVKYSDRQNSGTILMDHNKELGSRGEFIPSSNSSIGMRCRVDTSDELFENIKQRYRYMFTTLEERAKALDKQLIQIQDAMCRRGGITELTPVGVPSQDMTWVCGRICSDSSDGSLDPSSVLLEGSRRDSGGRRIQLDLIELKGYSLFPGQVVLVEGVNSSGRRMVARRIIEGYQSPMYTTPISDLYKYHHSEKFQFGKALNVLIASGPFTTSDNLKYEPLLDLLQLVANQKPDVLILTGPFVDISQPLLIEGDEVELEDTDNDGNILGSHSASYEMIFVEKIIRDGIQVLFNSESDFGNVITNIIMIPSLLDAHHENVFPQPPFGNRDRLDSTFFNEPLGVLDVPFSKDNDVRKRVHLLPNPCTFRVNEVVFGVTANDVLSTLASEEINLSVNARLPRLAAHVLQQQSYAPVFPPPPDSQTQLDLRQARHWHIGVSPDVLILPSSQPVLAKDIFGTLVLNPGSLAFGTGGGSFAELNIHPMKMETLQEAERKLETDSNSTAIISASETAMETSTATATATKAIPHEVVSRSS